MSIHDTPSSKVVKFPSAAQAEPPLPETAMTAPLSPEQQAIVDSLNRLIEFIQTNSANINYMIAVIREHQPEDVDPDVIAAHHIYTTPIAANDWALAMQLMDASFKRRLTDTV